MLWDCVPALGKTIEEWARVPSIHINIDVGRVYSPDLRGLWQPLAQGQVSITLC